MDEDKASIPDRLLLIRGLERVEHVIDIAQAAKNRNLDKYSNIYISRLMEQAIDQADAGVKLPSDVPIVTPTNADSTGPSPLNEPPLPMPMNNFNSDNSNRSSQYR